VILKIFSSLVAKVLPASSVSEAANAVQKKPAPTPTRRFMPARVELQPSDDFITMLRGEPCTTMRIYRPGDSGPWLQIVHVNIMPHQWHDVSDSYIRYVAEKYQIETSDLRKAVDALCSGR